MFRELVPLDSKILMIGCGNALLSEDMYNDGYHNITNIDISPIVIKQMSERNKEKGEMKYEVMDVTEMSYRDKSFDVVIDKSTIDTLLCSINGNLMIAKMTKEI
jgi:2-polyprenyl-3-methyl-5-hydroxy-6-metoxy-1,4-benzoquinol methylase